MLSYQTTLTELKCREYDDLGRKLYLSSLVSREQPAAIGDMAPGQLDCNTFLRSNDLQ